MNLKSIGKNTIINSSYWIKYKIINGSFTDNVIQPGS